MELRKLSDDDIENTVKLAVSEAVDFIESEIAPDRIKAQRYFDGETDLGYEARRSKVVATKCRDTVRAVKPALMRVFLQSGHPVEFTPRGPQAVQAAEQATQYARYIFERNSGFTVLSDVFHDALIKKVGIAKAYYDEVPEVEFDEYTGIGADALAFVASQDGVEIVEQTQTGESEMGPLFDVKVSREKQSGSIKIDSIAPEDFFVDRDAVSIDNCYVCGHSTEGRVGDLVEMGFDFDEVYLLAGDGDNTGADEEDYARTGRSTDDGDQNINDPSMRKILITEAYMRMDIEGTGIPRLYKFLCAGQDYAVLDYEICDGLPFAIFEVDPEPHTFFGRSLVDIIVDDQDAATALMRGLLDSVSILNNPRLLVNDTTTNLQDAMNNEIGGIIRTKDTQTGVRELVMGGASTAALPAMEYFDETIRTKTGVTGAGMGMDADALQSQTAAGVNAAVQAASAVSELIARTLAEGGMKRLFGTIAKLARAHPQPGEMMRINGEFVPVDPTSWGTELDLCVNVGLGTNAHDQKFMTLSSLQQMQMQVYSSYGPGNGLVTLSNIRNTAADILDLGGIHNAERHLQPMTPEREQQLMQQAAQQAAQQQQGSDPNAAFLQAEQMKAQLKAQTDSQKTVMEHQRKMLEMASSDDLQRDQMAQDLLVQAAKILGQYGTTVDVARVQAEQAAPRQMMGPQNG